MTSQNLFIEVPFVPHTQRHLGARSAGWDRDENRPQFQDFRRYESEDGLFADFHSHRHLFITSLELAGLSPKMAQTLARHSDVRLTLGIYTHVGLHDQTAAIQSLPAPPSIGPQDEAGRCGRRERTARTTQRSHETCRAWCRNWCPEVPKWVPNIPRRSGYGSRQIALKAATSTAKTATARSS